MRLSVRLKNNDIIVVKILDSVFCHEMNQYLQVKPEVVDCYDKNQYIVINKLFDNKSNAKKVLEENNGYMIIETNKNIFNFSKCDILYAKETQSFGDKYLAL